MALAGGLPSASRGSRVLAGACVPQPPSTGACGPQAPDGHGRVAGLVCHNPRLPGHVGHKPQMAAPQGACSRPCVTSCAWPRSPDGVLSRPDKTPLPGGVPFLLGSRVRCPGCVCCWPVRGWRRPARPWAAPRMGARCGAGWRRVAPGDDGTPWSRPLIAASILNQRGSAGAGTVKDSAFATLARLPWCHTLGKRVRFLLVYWWPWSLCRWVGTGCASGEGGAGK
jgi:hypothetical protein